jgi:hypothetical protein
MVSTNTSPSDFAVLNHVPIKFSKGTTVFMDSYEDRVGVDTCDCGWDQEPHSSRSGRVRTERHADQRAVRPACFVRASIQGVLREAIIAAGLTGLMILLFLGSWRSTLIIAVSIPLSILSSLFMLSALGHMMNEMTLGGLALAIGILVHDATVTIENIHRHMGRKPLRQAVLDGASQIAAPTLVSRVTICIVCNIAIWAP